MSRKNRKYGKSGIYHIIIRGNDKQNIFYDENDRFHLLNRLSKYARELNIQVFAYCLMNNHVHMLIGNGNFGMSKFMLKLNTSYSMYFNRKYERCGHLFQGRYLSETIEDTVSFKEVIRYIFYNPVKAWHQDFTTYKWCSYKHFLLDKESIFNNFLDKQTVLNIFESKNSFINFNKLYSTDIFMEYENKPLINDERGLILIKKLLKINNISSIKKYDSKILKNKLSLLRRNGLPVNQISRLTGISRHIILLS